jgi:uncharacterized membrane protein YcaP (DUF421 family)
MLEVLLTLYVGIDAAYGQENGGHLTISELAVMATLGAIVSPAMRIPQLGVLMGIIILICVGGTFTVMKRYD